MKVKSLPVHNDQRPGRINETNPLEDMGKAGMPAKSYSIKPSTPRPSVRVAKPARKLPADREHKAEVPSIRR